MACTSNCDSLARMCTNADCENLYARTSKARHVVALERTLQRLSLQAVTSVSTASSSSSSSSLAASNLIAAPRELWLMDF